MTLATSRGNGSGEYEEVNIEVVIERATKEELLGLSLLEIRQESIERAEALIVAVQ